MPTLITPDIRKCKQSAEERVCAAFGVTVEEINNESRIPKYSQARFVVYQILKEEFGINSSIIGQLYAKHFTSVNYGISRAKLLGLVAVAGSKKRN